MQFAGRVIRIALPDDRTNNVDRELLPFMVSVPFPAGVRAALATCGAGLLTVRWGSLYPLLPGHLTQDLKAFFYFQKNALRICHGWGSSAIEQLGITGNIIYSMMAASSVSGYAAHQILHNAYMMTFIPGISLLWLV